MILDKKEGIAMHEFQFVQIGCFMQKEGGCRINIYNALCRMVNFFQNKLLSQTFGIEIPGGDIILNLKAPINSHTTR